MKKHLLSPWHEYVIVMIIVLISTLLCYFVQDLAGYRVLSFVLLFVVSILAFFYGTGPVLMASTLSAIIWNFFFIPPHYTLHIDNTEDLLMFVMFFIIALLNGVLTSQVRHRENLLKAKEERTRALYELTRALSEENDLSKLQTIIEDAIQRIFQLEARIIMSGNDNQNQYLYPRSSFIIYPLQGSHLRPGVIALRQTNEFKEDQKQFWETCLGLISGKFEQEMLNEMAKKAYILGESDKLYKTLFSSVSHEFRIPVTTILGASDTLLAENYSEDIQRKLLQEINIASIRLNQLVENLLNISRLESGHLTVKLNWYDFQDLIDKVVKGLTKELKPYDLQISVPDDLPMLKLDFGLIEQVLYNLLLNITQYVPQQTTIELKVELEDHVLIIWIFDQGKGFPVSEINHVFDKFYRGKSVRTGGTGLGLSIVKGFVEAHQGSVKVYNQPAGGAVFEIRIPVEISEIQLTE